MIRTYTDGSRWLIYWSVIRNYLVIYFVFLSLTTVTAWNAIAAPNLTPVTRDD